MEERDRILTADEGEETMVAPRFDDEETVLARPVVPFEEVGADAPQASSASVPPYARAQSRPRRSLVAALVLVSALVGSVLGVGGLYLYQKQRSDDAAPAAAAQPQADAPASQPTPAPASESRADEKAAPAQSSNPAPTPDESDAKAGDNDSAREAGPEEAKAAPAAERRDASEGAVVAPKRGKKGERDEELQRDDRRERRDKDDDRQLRADDAGDGPVARRVGVITYRPRRARARRDAYGDPDRLRRIFEGQP